MNNLKTLICFLEEIYMEAVRVLKELKANKLLDKKKAQLDSGLSSKLMSIITTLSPQSLQG